MNEDLAQDAALWRANRLPLAEFCQRLVSNHQLHPLFHHWLQLHGQRSMRGVRMNTLGWFDFKSAGLPRRRHKRLSPGAVNLYNSAVSTGCGKSGRVISPIFR